MNNYKVDELKEYIDKTKVITINDFLKIRLSEELMVNYDNRLYDNEIKKIIYAINEINKINMDFPANATPVYYIYIVPDDDFVKLLNFPTIRSTKGGGKIVQCYDLDGFSSAYGISSNMMIKQNETNIMEFVNIIHELAHMIHGMFYSRERYLCEGFAEMFPLYILDYEKSFIEHSELLKVINEKDILSVQELIDLQDMNEFDGNPLLENASCSFDKAYVSSYLFVRGCVHLIEEKYDCNKIEAMHKFLEIVRFSKYNHQYLVFDIAKYLDVDIEDALMGKYIQYIALTNIFRNK